ncbi:MAG: T9SS type A sorting domain-containing protein, partial [Cryomorphaceae bacterium]
NSGSSQIKFPVGKNNRFRPLVLTDRSMPRVWTVEYFDTLAIVEPGVTSMAPSDPSIIKTISIQEYWKVNSNSASSTTSKVGLSWGENSGVDSLPGFQSKLVVLSYNTGADTWDSFGGEDHSGTATDGSFTSGNNLSFSERLITIGSRDEINPLPVTWLYFNGETDGNLHTLTWATSAEINNDHFVLERSLDAENWRPIAQIDGAGYSNTTQYYSYNDRTAPMGRAYYRIKQVDYDFKEEYAPNMVTLMKLMSQEGPDFDFVVFPNPSQSGNVNLLVSELRGELVDFIVSDISGRVVRSETIWIDGQGISEGLNLNYNPGVYLLIVRSNDRVQSQKLIIGN